MTQPYNPTTFLPQQHNKWESASHLNEYYMVKVIAIPYQDMGAISFLSLMRTIDTLPQLLIFPTPIARIPQNIICIIGKEGSMGFMQTLVLHVQVYMQGDYTTDKFMHVPTFSYTQGHVPSQAHQYGGTILVLTFGQIDRYRAIICFQ